MEVVLVAIIASLISPSILAIITSRQRRAEKKQDWEREDAVAAKALVAAELVATTLKETNIATDKKLDSIHTAVNSNLTEAIQSELDSSRAQLVLMKEVIELRGGKTSKETEDAIRIIEAKIKKLEVTLNDRI